jgi:hypothetical protein
MSTYWRCFPHVMLEQDLTTMREAMRRAIALSDPSGEKEEDLLARVIFRYYKRGLSNPERLAAIAIFLASSNVFNSPPTRAKVAVEDRVGASPRV